MGNISISIQVFILLIATAAVSTTHKQSFPATKTSIRANKNVAKKARLNISLGEGRTTNKNSAEDLAVPHNSLHRQSIALPPTVRYHSQTSVIRKKGSNNASSPSPSSSPLPPSSSTTGNYCGTTWEDAGNRCETTCPGGVDSECPSGQSCFADVSCGSSPPTSTTGNYCGTTWEDAGVRCQTTCPNGVDGDCPSGQYCFASITCTTSSSPTPAAAPTATRTPTPTATPLTATNYCGTDWENAQAQCANTCPTGVDSECPAGEYCFASITCSNGGTNPGGGNPEVRGYYELTWTASTPQADASHAVAFSGWVNVNNAIYESDQKYSSLVGSKYISFGGGNANGYWTTSAISSINNAISSGTLQHYDGICYDIEEGNAGLSSAFEQSFQIAKQTGFSVLVTISHSAPYGVSDKTQVMDTILSSSNVDYVSPQLYTTGQETQNDYATSGYGWSNYANRQPKIIVSITQSNLFSDAESTFSTYGVSLAGYILWTA